MFACKLLWLLTHQYTLMEYNRKTKFSQFEALKPSTLVPSYLLTSPLPFRSIQKHHMYVLHVFLFFFFFLGWRSKATDLIVKEHCSVRGVFLQGTPQQHFKLVVGVWIQISITSIPVLLLIDTNLMKTCFTKSYCSNLE